MEDLEMDLALGQDVSATVASVVTRSGRIFQPPNLQARSSSNPPAQRPNVPAAQRNTPLIVPIVLSGAPEDDIIKKQLEQIPAAISVWGLICSSKEHREKLSSTLVHLKDSESTSKGSLNSLPFLSLKAALVWGMFPLPKMPRRGKVRESLEPFKVTLIVTLYVKEEAPLVWDRSSYFGIRKLIPGYLVLRSLLLTTWSDSEDEELAKEKFKKQLAQIKEKTDWLKTFDQGNLELLFS
ncbi:hypothetical protein RHMOL_Rhmol04G0220100 [Rhododendron molle]|uniref:Uncharacterized protein n=1 Tax=Rhododendron molle TaxID=49168 RepID=A0ACC0P3C0_RHOML|nr:hypothetical protein RHMOL_Rhmol04G0220100 [Rhododendron molle]